MNVRKNIDYSTMFAALDAAMCAGMSQMKLYCELGRIICTRSEKGAAVAAAEYLSCHYPDVPGLSPRNLRRMRDFCRLYEREHELLALAMEIGWTQNVVILEADLNMEERRWYLRAVRQFGWTKAELQEKIAFAAHLENQLDGSEIPCYTESGNSKATSNQTYKFRYREIQQSVIRLNAPQGVQPWHRLAWQESQLIAVCGANKVLTIVWYGLSQAQYFEANPRQNSDSHVPHRRSLSNMAACCGWITRVA